MLSVRSLLAGAAALAAAATLLAAPPAQAAPSVSTHEYIVTLSGDGPVGAALQQVVSSAGGGSVLASYDAAIRGGLLALPDALAPVVAALPGVTGIERNGVVSIAKTDPTTTGTYGLDRIDQRDRPLSGTYTFTTTGAGVTAYIIDTGIDATHPDFGGRAIAGTNTVDGTPSTQDCNGHGTHVAGTVGSNTYGVAEGVTLVAVRVFGCADTTTTADIIEGVNWVVANHAAGVKAVANMSVGGGASQALDDAVRAMINDGVVTAVAAGNDGANACSNTSPARVAEAVTVGAVDSADARASFSNFGTCVDVHAAGVNVLSLAPGGGTATLSGTSMATPHVTGAAARYLQPAGVTAAQVPGLIVNNASTGKISGIATSCSFIQNLLGTCTVGTPNRLLYVDPAS